MRKGFSGLLIVAIVFGVWYWYGEVRAVCNVPLSYRIGTIDPRFDVSHEDVERALVSAESMWESRTGMELFTDREDTAFAINLVFDERQEATNEQSHLREVLEVKEEMSNDVRENYEKLLAEYETLRTRYESQVQAYEAELLTYNKEVSEWNERGGAPADIFNRLQTKKNTLAQEQMRLGTLADNINMLVRKMNDISEQGNTLVHEYNETVDVYNGQASEWHEFTQGEYGGGEINVYQFDSEEDLVLILSHELGHALSLQHVQGEESIMYERMQSQTLQRGLTADDLSEFSRVCGKERSVLGMVVRAVREHF